MSRNVSATFRAAAYAQETDQVFLVLVKIEHSSLNPPIRIVNNSTNITSGGEEYIGFPFEIELPDDTEDAPSRMSISFCNVDRQVVQAIRSLSGPPTITVSVVLASSPNTVEAGPYTMTLREADYDALRVSGHLLPEDFLHETYPKDAMTPSNFPGLF